MGSPVVSSVGDLVSVIVPVRNGEKSISLVIEGLLGQSHKSMEILISDNASTDGTSKLCEEVCARDPRVRYVRHESPVTALANFRYWIDKARGRYMIFAAHDDLRNRDFVKIVFERALAFDDTVCVTPSAFSFSSYHSDPFSVPEPKPMLGFRGDNDLANWRKLRQLLNSWGGSLVYGLIRRETLLSFSWPEIEFDNDVPLNLFLALSGRVVDAPEAKLFYFVPETRKSADEGALANNFTRVKPCRVVRMAWACSRAAADATRARNNLHAPTLLLFVPIYAYLKWVRFKYAVYSRLPVPVQRAWRLIKDP